MMRSVPRFAIPAIATIASAGFLTFAATDGLAVDGSVKAEITEWKVPYEGRPRDPFAAGSDEVWFVGQTDGFLARLTPSTGKFFKFDLGEGAGPHNAIVGKDGIVWIAGNRSAYVGRYDPKTNKLEKIVMPDPAAKDPHTLAFDKDQKHIWFTVQHGNFVGRLTLADRKVELIKVPTESARPYGIKIAPDGTPWVVLFGTNKLAKIDPAAMTLTEIELPHKDARPRRLEVTSKGRPWYVDFDRNTLGSYNPADKSFQEWPMPAGDLSRPYGTALDGRDRIWIAETGVEPNTIVTFDTASEQFVGKSEVESGGGVIRHMQYDAPANVIWFGADAGTIGRISVPD